MAFRYSDEPIALAAPSLAGEEYEKADSRLAIAFYQKWLHEDQTIDFFDRIFTMGRLAQLSLSVGDHNGYKWNMDELYRLWQREGRLRLDGLADEVVNESAFRKVLAANADYREGEPVGRQKKDARLLATKTGEYEVLVQAIKDFSTVHRHPEFVGRAMAIRGQAALRLADLTRAADGSSERIVALEEEGTDVLQGLLDGPSIASEMALLTLANRYPQRFEAPVPPLLRGSSSCLWTDEPLTVAQALSEVPADPTAEDYEMVAMALLAEGQLDFAEVVSIRGAVLDEEPNERLFEAWIHYRKTGRSEGLDDPEITTSEVGKRCLAWVHLDAGEDKEAVLLLQGGASGPELVDLAAAYYGAGQYQNAEGALLQALDRGVDGVIGYQNLAALYEQLGRDDEAAKAWASYATATEKSN